MEPSALLFRDLTFVFLAAVAGGFVAWLLRLPLILGFVLGGMVISPFTPGLQLSDLHAFEVFAEVGVVLLMFSIGVEFSVPDLLRVKWIAAIGAPLGIIVMIAMGAGVAWVAGWSIPKGIVVGAAVSVASTMVLARLLADAGVLNTTVGRVMIGITLVEDLAVVLLTVVLPTLTGSEGPQFKNAVWTLGKAIVLFIPLAFLAMKVIPKLIRKASATNDSELFLLVTIAICLGTAALAQAAGFSVVLGAFLAGLSISGSKELHDAHTRLIPLRDAFVALFFVSLGALIQPQVLRESLLLLAILLVMIIVGKFCVWAAIVRAFRYDKPTAIAVAAGLTQIGELSFVLVQVAHHAHLVGEELFIATIAASLISIFLNVFITRAVFKRLHLTPQAS